MDFFYENKDHLSRVIIKLYDEQPSGTRAQSYGNGSSMENGVFFNYIIHFSVLEFFWVSIGF